MLKSDLNILLFGICSREKNKPNWISKILYKGYWNQTIDRPTLEPDERTDMIEKSNWRRAFLEAYPSQQ